MPHFAASSRSASAGGARAKAVIAWNPDTQEIRSGQLDAPPGFEHWLLKFDGMEKDKDLGASEHYGRIEFAYSLMAKAAGIAMSDCRLRGKRSRTLHDSKIRPRRRQRPPSHSNTRRDEPHRLQEEGNQQLRTVIRHGKPSKASISGSGRDIPTDGIQCDGSRLRRPLEELLISPEAWKHLGVCASIQRYLRPQPNKRMDTPTLDVDQRQVQGLQYRRSSRSCRPVWNRHSSARHRSSTQGNQDVAEIRQRGWRSRKQTLEIQALLLPLS